MGVEDPEAVFMGWGSTYGVIKEATEKLVKKGYKIGYLHFSDIYPLPQKFLDNFKNKELYTVEENYEEQFATLIRKEACINVKRGLVKYNGIPFFMDEIVKRVKEIMG